MHQGRTFTIAAALLAQSAPAFAAHNLCFYSVLKEGSSLTVDGGAPQHIDGETVWFTTLPRRDEIGAWRQAPNNAVKIGLCPL